MLFSKSRGTYTLFLSLNESKQITIGKLGTFKFMAGCYVYIGSAFGTGGLSGRLKHHLSEIRKPHWHIDYLRQFASVNTIWYVESETIYEHKWAKQFMAMPGASIPAPRFGASDCRCKTHLIQFEQIPTFSEFSNQWKDQLTEYLLD